MYLYDPALGMSGCKTPAEVVNAVVDFLATLVNNREKYKIEYDPQSKQLWIDLNFGEMKTVATFK
jgi:hypothetical protein